MQKIWLTTLIAGILLGRCSQPRSSGGQKEKAKTEALLAGTYEGTLPCADCQGIAYRLTLKPNREFTQSAVYLGKSTRSYPQKGGWSLSGDSVVILKKDSLEYTRLRVQNNALLVLDRQGEIITGDLASRYILHRVTGKEASHSSAALPSDTIDFVASGNEPSWALEIDFSQQMYFHTLSGDTLRVPVPVPRRSEPDGKVIYQAVTEATTLQVVIQTVACTDHMSGDGRGYRVEVTANGKTYTGCGRYLFNALGINDIWALETLNGQIPPKGSYREVPVLEIHVVEQRLNGNAGCNQMMGWVGVELGKIEFSNLITTKMACPGDTEARFLKALTKTNTYRLESGKLVLLQEGEELMRLKKVD